MLFDPERTKDAGKRSGKARRRKAQERLTADRVLEELGPLETVDHAMRQLDRLNVWNASGLPTGSTNVAVVRSCVRSRRSDHLGASLALKRRCESCADHPLVRRRSLVDGISNTPRYFATVRRANMIPLLFIASTSSRSVWGEAMSSLAIISWRMVFAFRFDTVPPPSLATAPENRSRSRKVPSEVRIRTVPTTRLTVDSCSPVASAICVIVRGLSAPMPWVKNGP